MIRNMPLWRIVVEREGDALNFIAPSTTLKKVEWKERKGRERNGRGRKRRERKGRERRGRERKGRERKGRERKERERKERERERKKREMIIIRKRDEKKKVTSNDKESRGKNKMKIKEEN